MKNFQIRDCINSNITTLHTETSISEARLVLIKTQASDLYILNDLDELVGIVPDYDLLKNIWLGLTKTLPISSIMSPISLAVTCDDSFETIVQILSHHIHPKIAVVEGQKLLGTIDRITVMKTIIEMQSDDGGSSAGNQVAGHDVFPTPKFMTTGKNSDSSTSCSPHNP